jgi:TPR repeat protein
MSATAGKAKRKATPKKNQMNLICDGQPFTVAKSKLLDNLAFFGDHPERLSGADVQVQTKVTTTVFTEFVKALEGSEVDITEDNVTSLSALSTEFGFDSLKADCDSFLLLHPPVPVSSSIAAGVLESRLSSVEEQLELQDQQILSQGSEISTFDHRLKSVETELSTLRRSFESEQLYRRGQEIFHGEHGFERSISIGLSHLKDSSDRGHSDSSYVYGKYLLEGILCKHNIEESLIYLKKSVTSGNSFAEAAYAFAHLLHGEGLDLPDWHTTAFSFAKRSSDHGNSFGHGVLGSCFTDGIGVEKNPREALKYANMSADDGCGCGQTLYARCLEEQGNPRDVVESAIYYKMAADQGYFMGCLEFANSLLCGAGVEEDLAKGTKYLQMAGNRAIFGVRAEIAKRFEEDDTIANDLFTAAYLYKLDADFGSAEALESYDRVLSQLASRDEEE